MRRRFGMVPEAALLVLENEASVLGARGATMAKATLKYLSKGTFSNRLSLRSPGALRTQNSEPLNLASAELKRTPWNYTFLYT
jgi:hypothetical protein